MNETQPGLEFIQVFTSKALNVIQTLIVKFEVSQEESQSSQQKSSQQDVTELERGSTVVDISECGALNPADLREDIHKEDEEEFKEDGQSHESQEEEDVHPSTIDFQDYFMQL